jgi:hypothetical protein
MLYADAHVKYEYRMLIVTTGILRAMSGEPPVDDITWAVKNGLLNTFAVHARTLIDFLYSRVDGKDKPTDVIVQDYVDEAVVAQRLAPKTSLLKDAVFKAGKQVAHLTKERMDYEREGKQWLFMDIALDIASAFRSVAPYVGPTRMSNQLRSTLERDSVEFPQVDVRRILSSGDVPCGLSLAL